MSYDEIVITQSIWPAIFYHVISVAIFFLLFGGKILVMKKKNRSLFIFYSLLVVFIASIQFSLFTHGTQFAKSFLHIDLNIDAYDSVGYGALFYALTYLFAMPRNIFVKYI
ncbi:hypothetical protein FEM41_13715 [Jejubacter calystegiae]|uniref:Uncharacterized protein n=1 Tax=Jejubacter calystegiae TaxID=2579935 RepID=A0A4P8YKH0_9ENTR|nr:hypothetical protein [Jejubacter calystegiae]QCT20623.1 hypothetical protein FEM41_13715 [Jejubacter calystegiae]